MCYGGGLQKVNLKAQWSSIVTNEKTESFGVKKETVAEGWSGIDVLLQLSIDTLGLTQGAFLPLESKRVAARDLTKPARELEEARYCYVD